MAIFKFSLSSVLRLREHQRNHKRWELRSLYQSKKDVLLEIGALEKRLLDGIYQPAQGQILEAHELATLAEHARLAVELVKRKSRLLRELEASIAAKRAELIESMRAVKSLEQLRQRQQERHSRAENHAQQRFLDEIAQRKFVQPQARKKVPN
jgi:flagellar export protein FliJ